MSLVQQMVLSSGLAIAGNSALSSGVHGALGDDQDNLKEAQAALFQHVKAGGALCVCMLDPGLQTWHHCGRCLKDMLTVLQVPLL